MKAFVTGGTGFVGGRLVRSRDKAGDLLASGCTLADGDLDAVSARLLEGCDAVFHCAAVYRIGVRSSEAAALWNVNVDGTGRVLAAAQDAGVGRVVYVSTANVLGNTRGEVADETSVRDLAQGFLSVYDETKYRAHELARERMAAGAPVLVALPGTVYGPGDTSQLGEQVRRAMAGRLPYVSFPTLGATACYVDDIAAGLLAVHDRGRPGEEYLLGGERTRMRDLIAAAARAAERRPPRFSMPTFVIRAVAPVAPVVGPLLGLPPNLRETIAASDGVTYWFDDAKARRELGYAPRDLETGLAATFAAL